MKRSKRSKRVKIGRKIYESIRAAAESNGISTTTIYRLVKLNQKFNNMKVTILD